MKKFFILFFFIFVLFASGEIIIRNLGHQPMSDGLIKYQPVFSKNGIILNPSSGVIKSPPELNIQYKFYPPHLRDTKISSNKIPILVLGDSFTFGWLLPWNNTYISYLQTAVDQELGKGKYQFLNAGTPGWGTSDQLAYLEEFGKIIMPKFVLVFLNTDDIGKSIKKNIYKFPSSERLTLIKNYRPIRLLITTIVYNSWLYTHSVLLQLLHDYFHEIYVSFYHIPSKYDNNRTIPLSDDIFLQNKNSKTYAKELFIKMKHWCNEHNSKLLVITTGFNAFYPKNIYDPTKDFLSEANYFFMKEGISYYDIGDTFKKATDGREIIIPKQGHPNAFATKTIAQIIWPWLKDKLSSSVSNKRSTTI